MLNVLYIIKSLIFGIFSIKYLQHFSLNPKHLHYYYKNMNTIIKAQLFNVMYIIKFQRFFYMLEMFIY